MASFFAKVSAVREIQNSKPFYPKFNVDIYFFIHPIVHIIFLPSVTFIISSVLKLAPFHLSSLCSTIHKSI